MKCPDEASGTGPARSRGTTPLAPPCTMVLFGAAGDLTSRLVVPALYNLVVAGRLPEAFRLVGVDRVELDTRAWSEGLGEAMRRFAAQGHAEGMAAHIDPGAWEWLAERMSYRRGDLNDAGTYRALGGDLAALEETLDTGGNRLFYLAVAERFFGPVVRALGAAGLVAEADAPWRRVVVEKPFGHDLDSARALNEELLETLAEHQIYRMDHFLGKETVQNIMALRFANGVFEPLWNRAHVDHVQISVAETVGVEHRGTFYERTGALRDMVPNHLFQLLAMTAMEPPISFDANAVRSRKAELLDAVRPPSNEEVARCFVRGQYSAGTVAGTAVRDYRAEPDVAPDSSAETYVAGKLLIDNWRWSGVPFYFRTGKSLARRASEIAIRFHQAPYSLFRGTDVERMNPNWLIIRIQPDEGIALEIAAKRPGPSVSLGSVRLDFAYADWFDMAPNTGYETLLYDVMIGDATLFQRADAVESGWRIVQPVLDAWKTSAGGELERYAAGSDGPPAADALLERDGRAWRALTPRAER